MSSAFPHCRRNPEAQPFSCFLATAALLPRCAVEHDVDTTATVNNTVEIG
jgi:hypothetical protein